jgi:hypothetical protein
MVEAVEAWKDFNVAMAGATAALAGLVIVAASVNISDIIKAPALTARLGAGVGTLVLALVVAALGLMPGLTLVTLGLGVLLATAVAGVLQADAARRILQDHDPKNQGRLTKATLGFLPLLAYLLGGVLLVTGTAGGLGWLAAGAIFAIIGGLLVSWVVLVEVLR